MAPAEDATTRFSTRVHDYVKYRPDYPIQIIELLSKEFDIPQNAHIVDVGSGTGILSRQILETLRGKNVKVTGVEPNKEMREAGDKLLSEFVHDGRFSSVDGTAENTGITDHTVDLIVAAQAFHWFDVPKARIECMRILKQPSGESKSGAALIWNDRRGVGANGKPELWSFTSLDSPVMSAYDLLLVERGNEYRKVTHHRTVDENALKQFFGLSGFNSEVVENPFKLDFAQLRGRLLSSSYTPLEGEQGYEEMMADLQRLFDTYQKDGKIDFYYDTRMFYGPMDPEAAEMI